MSDRILAAVMPAPRQPIEVREFAASRPAARRRAAADGALGSLRHRRAPLARPAGRRAVSDHSRPRLGRRRSSRSAAARRARRLDAARRRSRRLLRRAPHVRPLPRLHGAPHADALPGAARLRHHRFGGRGAVRRLVAGDLSRARRRHRAPARRGRRSTTTSAAAAAC